MSQSHLIKDHSTKQNNNAIGFAIGKLFQFSMSFSMFPHTKVPDCGHSENLNTVILIMCKRSDFNIFQSNHETAAA